MTMLPSSCTAVRTVVLLRELIPPPGRRGRKAYRTWPIRSDIVPEVMLAPGIMEFLGFYLLWYWLSCGE